MVFEIQKALVCTCSSGIHNLLRGASDYIFDKKTPQLF